MVVAFANIQIPLQLGVIVNNLTKFTTNNQGDNFWSQMKEPVFKILVTYSLQVNLIIICLHAVCV